MPQLILWVSVRIVIQSWLVMLAKLPILRPISLGAQRPNRPHTCTFQHWQRGRRTPISVGTGKIYSLASPFYSYPNLPLMTIPTETRISAVAFLSDGTRIVAGSYDDLNPVQVWDASTGAELKVHKGHTSHVESVAFKRWHDERHVQPVVPRLLSSKSWAV